MTELVWNDDIAHTDLGFSFEIVEGNTLSTLYICEYLRDAENQFIVILSHKDKKVLKSKAERINQIIKEE